MLRSIMRMAAAAAVLAVFASSAQAQIKGGLTCPKGKVEVKSLGVFYVPEKRVLSIFFTREAISSDEMDAILAQHAKFILNRNPKGPTGKTGKEDVDVAFEVSMELREKSPGVVGPAELAGASDAWFKYFCDSDRLIEYPQKERVAKVRAAVQAITVELKPGGKVNIATTGSYDGDAKDKVKVTWDIQGVGVVRVYE